MYQFKPQPPNQPKQSKQRAPRNYKTERQPQTARRPQIPLTQRNPRPSPRTAKPKVAVSPVIKNGPITPDQALESYSSLLTSYEMREIKSFPEVYYLGIKSKKISISRYDDGETFNYRIIPGDHLAYRFEILSSFGCGAFGEVVRCMDHKTKKQVAVKIIVNTEQMHEQGMVEAKILSKLNRVNAPNVVKAYDFFIFRSHICISYEILGANLYEYSQSINFRSVPLRSVRNVAIQMLKSLEAIHGAKIIHADLKPENVLLVPNTDFNVKIIDFGSSCFFGHQKYEYIQSRFYRAPEVVFGISYGAPMDIWSFALVLTELYTGNPMFPADSELELLSMIGEILGDPPKELIIKGKRRDEFYDRSLNLKIKKKAPKSKSLKQVLRTNDEYFIDFIAKCLTWDQEERITATEALQHPWITMKELVLKKAKSGALPVLC